MMPDRHARSWADEMERKGTMPADVAYYLAIARTPEEMEEIITANMGKIATCRNFRKERRFWLPCSEAAEVMAVALEFHRIPYQWIKGMTDAGVTDQEPEDHEWIRVDGCDYDPTSQGTIDGEIVYSWPDKKET